jgi:hypothetical protein
VPNYLPKSAFSCSTSLSLSATPFIYSISCLVYYVAAETNVIVCQICNVISQSENLIENRFFSKFWEDDINASCDDETKDVEEEKKCTNCAENAIATSWCVECEELICQNCVMASDFTPYLVSPTFCPNGIFTHIDCFPTGAPEAENNKGPHDKA